MTTTGQKKYYFMILAFFCFLFFSTSVQAENFLFLKPINYPLDEDYVLVSPEKEVSLKISAGATNQNLIVKMMRLANQENIGNFFTYPSEIAPASDLYLIRFSPAENSFFVPPEITLKYNKDDNYKEAYYYDWADLIFKKLETMRHNGSLTFALPPKKSVIFALFNEPQISGKASWYVHPKYPGELIAASRDFGLDAKIKVKNPANGKEATVAVKDYGPKKCEDWTEKELVKMGPCENRIIDLSKTAFKALASAWEGVIDVLISPVVY